MSGLEAWDSVQEIDGGKRPLFLEDIAANLGPRDILHCSSFGAHLPTTNWDIEQIRRIVSLADCQQVISTTPLKGGLMMTYIVGVSSSGQKRALIARRA